MRNSETYELRNIILVNSSGEEYDIKSMMILLNSTNPFSIIQ